MTIKKSSKDIIHGYIIEWLKCKNNFEYFCTNYIYLEIPGGDVKINPYDKQKELIKIIEKDKHVIVLKSRQTGISTIIQSYCAWLTVFYNNVVVGVVSKDGPEATSFARIIRGFIEKLPTWMKPKGGSQGKGFAKKTEQSFILTNGSKVFSAAVNPIQPDKTLRGKALTFLIIDEAAYVSRVDDAWTGIVPALSTNQSLARKANVPYGTLILSTPNKTVGVGQFYYQKYLSAVNKGDILKPFIIHWKQIPELADDPLWYETQCRLFNNDPRKIAQELELKFLPAEGSFLPAEVVEKIQNAKKDPIKTIKMFNGEAWVFKSPSKEGYYLVAVDSASEHGTDRAAITVWDYETFELCWEYNGKCKVKNLLNIVKLAIHLYPGLLVIENNSYGDHLIEELEDTDYGQFLYTPKDKQGNKKYHRGLNNNSQTRPLMIESLYSFASEFPHLIVSERLGLELTGLVMKKGGRVEGDSGCFDDIALSMSMATYVKKYDPPLMIEKMNTGSTLSHFKDIIGMNEDDDNNFKNVIINKIQGNINSEQMGIVNIMDMYAND